MGRWPPTLSFQMHTFLVMTLLLMLNFWMFCERHSTHRSAHAQLSNRTRGCCLACGFAVVRYVARGRKYGLSNPLVLEKKMQTEEKLLLLKSHTQEVKRLIETGEIQNHPFLQGFLEQIETALVSGHL